MQARIHILSSNMESRHCQKIRLPNRPCFNSKFIPGNDWCHQLFLRCGVKTVLVRPALKVLHICIFMKILSRKTRPALGPTGPQTCSPAALKAHCARPGLIYRQIYVQPGLISPNYHCGREVSKYILLGEFHRHSFIKSTWTAWRLQWPHYGWADNNQPTNQTNQQTNKQTNK